MMAAILRDARKGALLRMRTSLVTSGYGRSLMVRSIAKRCVSNHERHRRA